MIEKLSNKIIAIGGAITAIIGIIMYLGFQSPGEVMDRHILDEEKTHIQLQTKLDSTAQEMVHIEHIETLLEGILRGECIENPRENLARQGLLQKCAELGITR